VLVDSVSMEYLRGARIDYREDAMGANFVIDNPQAQTTCGCGSSFNPY
jgi:iron-sulfur cluster insertion protein